MKLSKSKLALAKIINENGGWIDCCDGYAAQDGDCVISFYEFKPKWIVAYQWWSLDYYGRIGEITGVSYRIKNHHQIILSREEYYQAYPKADADEWIEWKGGMKSPVESGVPVDVKTKDGYVHRDQLLGDACWRDNWGDANIISYRLHKPDVKPEFCESVMRSIPDPESNPTIDQLAQDYRNAKDYAERRQQEADDAKAAADAALGELERAGEALGFVVTPVREDRTPNPIIADCRYLKIGDAVRIVRDNIGGRYNGYEGHVAMIDPDDTRTPVLVNLSFGTMWCHEVEFIK